MEVDVSAGPTRATVDVTIIVGGGAGGDISNRVVEVTEVIVSVKEVSTGPDGGDV